MIKNKMKPRGNLITNNVRLEPHEMATIEVLLADGNDVELLRRSRTPRSKSADIFMVRLVWEMKAPDGKTFRAVD